MFYILDENKFFEKHEAFKLFAKTENSFLHFLNMAANIDHGRGKKCKKFIFDRKL